MIYKSLSNCVNLAWPGRLHTLSVQLLKTDSQTSKNVGSAPRFLSINADMFKHVSGVTLQSQTPLPPASHLLHSETLYSPSPSQFPNIPGPCPISQRADS